MAKKRKLPKHLRLSMLRPKLRELLQAETMAGMKSTRLQQALDDLFQDLTPEKFLPILVKSAGDAEPEVQVQLNQILPVWLEERQYVRPLLEIAERRDLDAKEKQCVQEWLKKGGVSPRRLEKVDERPNLFYKAYTYTDEFGSQGYIVVIWYTDKRRRRATGFQFLIDHNPPWEGALKDSIKLPKRSPETLAQRMVEFWDARDSPPTEVDAAEVKKEILTALQHNREENIRLPKDLIPYRKPFIEQILSLPDTPETPEFTPEDFDELSKTGKTPESINLFERAVGRRVRKEDGTEIFVMGEPFEDEPW